MNCSNGVDHRVENSKPMDISVIVVNFNTKNLLRNCLHSVYETIRNISFEVLVVDNASPDGSLTMLREEFLQVKVIENPKNRGFAAGNNQALAMMKGRYALLLNTDTVLKENAVYELFSFMETHPEAAMASGQLLNADGSKQNSIANFPSLSTLLFNVPFLEMIFPQKYPSKRYPQKDPIEIDSGVGACLLVRRKAIEEVGLFDERYFFFFEETDWALQMKMAGWKTFHVPTAYIYHFQGQSIGQDIRSRIEFYRSRYQFFRKWNTYSYYILIAFIIFFRLMINWMLTSVGIVLTMGFSRGMRNKCIIYSQLFLWHIRGRPYLRHPVN
jgi:GT2 family glycosyltransferase